MRKILQPEDHAIASIGLHVPGRLVSQLLCPPKKLEQPDRSIKQHVVRDEIGPVEIGLSHCWTPFRSPTARPARGHREPRRPASATATQRGASTSTQTAVNAHITHLVRHRRFKVPCYPHAPTELAW